VSDLHAEILARGCEVRTPGCQGDAVYVEHILPDRPDGTGALRAVCGNCATDLLGQPMTQAQTDQIVEAIMVARNAGRTVIGVEFPRILVRKSGPWSILGVDLVYHSWYTDGFNLKLDGIGAFARDDEYHQFAVPCAVSPR
jgi:hypothetical protein